MYYEFVILYFLFNIQIVLDEYRIQGLEFFFKTFESNKYLEDLTGLTKLKELDEKVIIIVNY